MTPQSDPVPTAAARSGAGRPAGRWRQALRTVMRYALLGPAIGTAAFTLFLIALGSREVLDRGESLAAWLGPVLLLGTTSFLIFGYVLGAVPALLTGLLAAWMEARLTTDAAAARPQTMPGVLLLTAVGGLASLGFARWIGQDLGTAWQMAACGALAAGVCALTGARRRRKAR